MRRERLSGPDGVRFRPDRPSGVGALVVAGSSGRVDEGRARVLAGHGVLAESVRWFGGAGQSPGPWEVPLETFADRVAALAGECDRVALLGTSFGAEGALATAARTAAVDLVVAFAPSDVVWAGIAEDGRVTSHWTHAGVPLPHVPFDPDWAPDTDPPAYRSLYARSRERFADAVPAATIAVERIPEVVLVAGGDDRVWPAVDHARRIAARRAEHGLDTVVVTDEEAGHRTVLPGEDVVRAGAAMARGGTEAADRRLGVAAWDAIVRWLSGDEA